MSTWILLAQRGGACLLERANPKSPPRIVQRVDHPEGRLQDVELGSDRPGRQFDRGGPGRSAYTREEMPHQHIADAFARELAALLERGRLDNRYDELVLIAAPRFLGRLRAALSDPTSKLVTASSPKEIDQLDDREIVERVRSFLDEAAAEPTAP